MVVIGQSGSIRVKMVLLAKSGCIKGKVVIFRKVVVVRQ